MLLTLHPVPFIISTAGGKRALLLFGWMYERYEAQYHWYELTQLVQKTIFVLVMIFLLTDPILQVSSPAGLCILPGIH
jgi:hypothetical protein